MVSQYEYKFGLQCIIDEMKIFKEHNVYIVPDQFIKTVLNIISHYNSDKCPINGLEWIRSRL